MVCEAAARAGVPRASIYRRRTVDPDFAAAWAAALEAGLDRLRDEAVRRARDGVEETVWHGGKPVGTVRRYSDQLLMFLLRAHQPAIYREPRGSGGTGSAGDAALRAAQKAIRRAEQAADERVADAYELGQDLGVREWFDSIDRHVRKHGGPSLYDDDEADVADADEAGADAGAAGGAAVRSVGPAAAGGTAEAASAPATRATPPSETTPSGPPGYSLAVEPDADAGIPMRAPDPP